jgi:aerobic-type carbon monoxide dehydrogenase small subunit (CoxS/CutS family)
MQAKLTLTVNGKRQEVSTEPQRPLLDVLREDLGLTGAKYGCGEGRCGACVVLVDGVPTHSCITPASQADGKGLLTIEGLADGEKLHPVQEAFLAEAAYQCGYCTSGMVLAAVALLKAKASPTEAEIISHMDSHLCRCCGYVNIVDAVKRAAGNGRAGQ